MKEKINELTEEECENINKYLYGYITNNKEKNIKKISTKKWTIVEYDNRYVWTIYSDKINVEKEYIFLFQNKDVEEITIDDTTYKDYWNLSEENFKNFKKTTIVVKK